VTDPERLRDGSGVTSARPARWAGPARRGSPAAGGHHHLACRRCGEIAGADCAVSDAACLEPIAAAGFVIDRAEVTFWGLCPGCRAAGAVPGSSLPPGSAPPAGPGDG
jgi:hypothetical protein